VERRRPTCDERHNFTRLVWFNFINYKKRTQKNEINSPRKTHSHQKQPHQTHQIYYPGLSQHQIVSTKVRSRKPAQSVAFRCTLKPALSTMLPLAWQASCLKPCRLVSGILPLRCSCGVRCVSSAISSALSRRAPSNSKPGGW